MNASGLSRCGVAVDDDVELGETGGSATEVVAATAGGQEQGRGEDAGQETRYAHRSGASRDGCRCGVHRTHFRRPTAPATIRLVDHAGSARRSSIGSGMRVCRARGGRRPAGHPTDDPRRRARVPTRGRRRWAGRRRVGAQEREPRIPGAREVGEERGQRLGVVVLRRLGISANSITCGTGSARPRPPPSTASSRRPRAASSAASTSLDVGLGRDEGAEECRAMPTTLPRSRGPRTLIHRSARTPVARTFVTADRPLRPLLREPAAPSVNVSPGTGRDKETRTWRT